MSAKDDQVILRYGELAAIKARGEATRDNLLEMDQIRKDLNLTDMELIDKVERLVKKNY
ncbi:MAG: hypothetical protein Q8L64_05310 [bacterium]|nr:hypothetical protein [bacterium]